MATTRELVTSVLARDEQIRDWWATHREFTLDKVQSANLSEYEGYTAAIIAEGIEKGLIEEAQVTGDRAI